MENVEMMTDANIGETRRGLLKKAAIGGAIVWSVPMIVSSPAFAASAQCDGSRACTTFYGVSIATNSGTGVSTKGPAGSNGPCGMRNVADLKCSPTSPTPTLLDGSSFLTLTTSSGTGICFTLAAGIVPIFLDFHFGGNCSGYRYNETTKSFDVQYNTPNGGGGAVCNPTIAVTGSIAAGLQICVTKNAGDSACGLSGTNIFFCN